ncbi:helix-turn-helix domain-containing protein [Frigidibacter sp.]|uniref:winged helix-turn-helix transcriptional regulator n=1 Tax=Frigidibacter sp. TaxID=2586418 RepID=UPI0027344C3E|nr:helix-turn-helix domain-containing protein [Frigidibacter sp.]MDP3340754.1 helix-turn-helix domain-containing protein [Frigidibacter sp.]
MPKDLQPDVMNENCPSRRVLNHVTSRWGVLILIALQGGTLRFSALRRRIGGVSERMLAQSLRLLEEDGMVRRTAHPVVPPHVEYDLTPLGDEVAARVKALADCLEGNLARIPSVQAMADGDPGRT